METFLDRLHARARRIPAFQRLAIVSRILLGLAFLPTGLVKLLGERFTLLSIESPVGGFFEAMYQTGAYWQFLGFAQMFAAALLLIPRTATLGAVVFFPIALNVFVITVAIDFRGTKFITGAMLLAAIFLLCWDYDRLKAIVWPPARREEPRRAPIGRLERSGYVLGTVAGLGVLAGLRGLVPNELVLPGLVVGLLAALIVLASWIGLARVPVKTG